NDLHMDYTAVGQTTHLAARMEQMAMPGSILITVGVLGLAEGYVQVKPLGPVPVRGLPLPVEVCEVVGAGPGRRRWVGGGGGGRGLHAVGAALWDGRQSLRHCARPSHALAPGRARWWPWSGSLVWGSRGCSMSSPVRIVPRTGSSSRAAPSLTARPRHICRSSI